MQQSFFKMMSRKRSNTSTNTTLCAPVITQTLDELDPILSGASAELHPKSLPRRWASPLLCLRARLDLFVCSSKRRRSSRFRQIWRGRAHNAGRDCRSGRPGRKVQSLQTNTGFECTEVAPTSPSDRAVVHPVSSPIRCVMIRSLPAGAGRLPVSSGVARDSH